MPRAALIVSELLMGITAVGGGLALLAGVMDHWLPIAWLQDSPFADYRLPALALIVLVGGGNFVAAILLLARQQWGIIVSIAAGGFLIAFEIVEVAAMGLRMWLQPFCFILGVVIVGLALRLRATGRTAGWVSR
jgi:hypothetical protein